MRRVDTGLFSTWLVDRLTAGDEIEVGPPAGSLLPRRRARASTTSCVAAGSGITPVLSIAATVLAAHPDTHVTLLYGNRRSDTVMFGEDLADLKDRYGPAPAAGARALPRAHRVGLFNGRLDADRLRTLIGALVAVGEVAHWWLCGPLGMVEDAGEVLAGSACPARGCTASSSTSTTPRPRCTTRRTPSTTTAAPRDRSCSTGARAPLTLPRNEPVLDAAQKVRSDLPFACKGGVCGTCRAHVTAGEVRMRRNFALEPEEVDAGFVLTCQSLPVSSSLVIDYDI